MTKASGTLLLIGPCFFFLFDEFGRISGVFRVGFVVDLGGNLGAEGDWEACTVDTGSASAKGVPA